VCGLKFLMATVLKKSLSFETSGQPDGGYVFALQQIGARNVRWGAEDSRLVVTWREKVPEGAEGRIRELIGTYIIDLIE
jgi:hypothetical protein